MKIFVQHKNHPSQVLFAFDDVVDSMVERVRWAVAYSTLRGCKRLVARVADRIGQNRWDDSQKFFVTALDFGLTEPAALEFLADQPNSQVQIANPAVLATPGFRPAQAYHPKLFLFDQPGGTGYVVGSANLTGSALISNTEVVSAGQEIPTNGVWNDVWIELMRDTVPLTTALLQKYSKKWSRPKPRAVDPDPRPKRPTIRPANQPVFGEAITTGGISPLAFAHLWVEAGPMRSGGSYNQLELPRGAHRFFGFTHSDYGSTHVVPIGHITFAFRGQIWRDRPLRWHGHNKMERINLPTGFDYHNTAVLFRRHNAAFEISVFPWDDDAAVAWRAASEALRTVFRLGERGQRICGLF